jgi:hypothetical protein
VLASCYLLGACGSKFTAGDAAGGTSGASGQGGEASSGAGGSAARAGTESAGRAGDDIVGDAGTDSGGAATTAGSSNDSGGGGAGGGIIIGHGGTSGNAGSAGGSDQPDIPRLGLALWLRADTGVQQANGLVQVWLDQSGNQRNAVQTGLLVRPTYVAKGLNDLPTLQFDGVGDFLKLPDGFGDFSNGVAGFMVVQPADSDCASVLELSNGSEIQDVSLGMWQNKWTYEVQEPYIQNGNVDLLAPTLYAVNHRPTIGMVNASAELRINRTALQAKNMPVPDVMVRENNFVGHTLYGSCNYFEGTVSEIILYERVVTANEVKSIESYLDQHWDLGLAATP